MSRETGDRPTIRGFFEEDTPVYSSRRDKLDPGVDHSKEYHPPALPPASPAHETIRIKPIELSRTIDPRRAPTQKLVVRRGGKPRLGPVPIEASRLRFWPIAFGVAALALAVVLLWYRHANGPTSPFADTGAPPLPTRGANAARDTALPLPLPGLKSSEPVSEVGAAEGLESAAAATKISKAIPRSASAQLPRTAFERAPTSLGSAKVNVAPSTPTTTAGEPNAPRDVWLQ